MIQAFVKWAKREFNPRTIRGWWLFSWIAPVWSVFVIFMGCLSTDRILTMIDCLSAGLLLATWAQSFTFRGYRKTCDGYSAICDKYHAELTKAHMALAVSEALRNSALQKLAEEGIVMTDVQVHIWPREEDRN